MLWPDRRAPRSLSHQITGLEPPVQSKKSVRLFHICGLGRMVLEHPEVGA
jgi:hypothetical protein